MNQWESKSSLPPFENAVRWLSPEAKKAMYAAAAGNLIKRNTWNGCAFNKAGAELGIQSVSSVHAAAEAFNMPAKSVANFIRQWDSLQGTDEECTARLREAIEKTGIFSPRGTVRLVSIEVFSGSEEFKKQRQMEDELNKMIDDGKAEFIENACAIADLLATSRA